MRKVSGFALKVDGIDLFCGRGHLQTRGNQGKSRGNQEESRGNEAKDKTLRYSVYRDGCFYPYYGKLEVSE